MIIISSGIVVRGKFFGDIYRLICTCVEPLIVLKLDAGDFEWVLPKWQYFDLLELVGMSGY